MLILMNKSDNNQKSAECIQTYHADAEDSSKCFVIDIEQKFFKKNITPDQFATQLLNLKLPASIQDIYLLTSEIEKDHFLSVFAHHLSQVFSKNHHRKINVHIPTYLSKEMTLIVPPEGKNSWKIYGINRSDLPQSDPSFNTILEAPNKQLIWEGNNIFEWMNDPQQTYNGIAYVWDNQ